jgi:hypothetical protein
MHKIFHVICEGNRIFIGWQSAARVSTNTETAYSSLMMEAVRTSETSVDNHSTWQYNPEDSSEHNTETT